jgi:hypothetical protein
MKLGVNIVSLKATPIFAPSQDPTNNNTSMEAKQTSEVEGILVPLNIGS